jgi:Fur family ferric uptake transcriptional regulator
MAHDIEKAALASYLEENNLKHTRQRDVILEAFLDASGHITGEELHQQIKDRDPSIGYTTVYRTLKLLVEAGLAQERHFDDGITRYEIEQEHHDHLVCTKCGRIDEFECAMIEKTQNEIAATYGFKLLRHRHELYGLCPNCQKKK